MRCGHCKKTHETVADVRVCYGILEASMDHQSASDDSCDAPPMRNNPTGEDRAPRTGSVAPAQVKRAARKWDEIPAGYYATPSLTGNNDYDFWKVDRPDHGKWAGYVFVKRVIGGHDDKVIPRDSKKRVKSQRTERVTQNRALEAILAFGVEKANEMFGTELKYCRKCGIHLTDELSRELGIGPVCRSFDDRY